MTAAIPFDINPMNQELTKAMYIDVEEYYGDQKIRWAQIAARNGVIQAIEEKVRTILVVMPTASGKTITIACTLDCPEIRHALSIPSGRKLRVLFFAHMHRLLTQAEKTFADSSGVELTLVTPFSDISQQLIDDCDIIVIDEGHHEAMMSMQYKLEQTAKKTIVALTATPDRPDGMVIKFERIIEPVSREMAVREGWLAETSIWSFIDTTGKNKLAYLKNIITQYHHIMCGTIVFVKTRAEAQALERFIIMELKLTAVALISQTKQQIDDILNSFSRGEVQFVINCSKIGEGVDVKGCVSVILGKNLGSYTQLNQYIGRTARPDSESQVFELINPLSGYNLDTTIVTGTPKSHFLCSPKRDGSFKSQEFDYVSTQIVGMTDGGGMTQQGRMRR